MTRDGLLRIFSFWRATDGDCRACPREFAAIADIDEALLGAAYSAYLERELIHNDPESWVSDHFDDSVELVLADSDLALDDALDAVLRSVNEVSA